MQLPKLPVSPKTVLAVVHSFLNVFTILFLLDFMTFSISTGFLRSLISLNRFNVFRWIFFSYTVYRLSLFVLHRVKLKKRLQSKREDLMDKHLRLQNKLKDVAQPTIVAEHLGALKLHQVNSLIRDKKITIVDLMDVYQKDAFRFIQQSQLRGVIAEIIFDADVYAIMANDKLEETSNVNELSPLHGIPVAIQEVFPVRGCDHTMGYTNLSGKPANDDCALVAVLKEIGAIPFILTNFRQKLLGLSAHNPIFGHAHHPTHPDRVCVNGDAVLVLNGGCQLSFSADILGGARLGAAFCGLTCLKPTLNRISQHGIDLPITMPHTLGVCPSPTARSVDELIEAARALWTHTWFDQDPLLPSNCFSEEKLNSAIASESKLRIGYYSHFKDYMQCCSATERVMEQAKSYLIQQGHELVEFPVPEPALAYQLVINALSSTMQPDLLRLLYDEGCGDIMVDHKQRMLHLLYALPQSMRRRVCNWRAKKTEGSFPVSATALRGLGCSRTNQQLITEIDEYRRLFYEQWADENLDCILCPVSPIPAPLAVSGFYVTNAVLLFTSLYNMLGCPAGTVRLGRVEKSDIELDKEKVKAGKFFETFDMIADQMKGAEGLPIGLQVVAKPWHDEVALSLMKQLESMNPIDNTP